MRMYEEEVDYLGRKEIAEIPVAKRVLFNPEQIEAITVKYAGLPAEFLHYLSEIGEGCVMDGQFNIYGDEMEWCGTSSMTSWFPSNGRRLLVFGSNGCGDLFAFDADQGFPVVELLHESGEVLPFEGGFKDFVRNHMQIDCSEEDLAYAPEPVPLKTGTKDVLDAAIHGISIDLNAEDEGDGIYICRFEWKDGELIRYAHGSRFQATSPAVAAAYAHSLMENQLNEWVSNRTKNKY
jgi:hypothetical protein